MSGTVQGVFHPAISVSDMGEALRFYRDLLGLEVAFDDFHDPEAISQLFGYLDPRVRSVVVRCPDGSEIELVEFQRPRGRRSVDRDAADAGILSVNLRVSGIEDMMARIRAGGYDLASDLVHQMLPDGGVIKVAVCRAPDGASIILVELPTGRDSLAASGPA